MANGNYDGSLIFTTEIDNSGLKKGISLIKKVAIKSFAAIGVAAAASTVAITKMSVSAYADYEQLVGGVETLFKNSADKVVKYAENAFATVGISANEYMQTVTSFSASLISSLGGDTEKAADIANMALVDMSDNANKMGSAIESIQNAYQGFAKQNYTMLDNLKLGYGGTKTEMQRLLKDAEALTGIKYDISNLADVYSAIHAVQEQLGITGTTAKEAEETISGSANMMKAAWKNALTAVAGGGDIDKAINNLVYSVEVYFKNLVPVIERSLSGIGTLISKVAPMLVRTVARSLIQSIPELVNATYQMVIGFGKGISEGIRSLFSGTTETISKQTNEIQASTEAQEGFTSAVEDTNKELEKSLFGFDKVNKLSSNSADATSDMAVNFAGGQAHADIQKSTKQYTKLGKVFEYLKDKLKPLNKISLKNLSNSLKNLKEALKPFQNLALTTLDWLWNDFLIPVGKWTVEDLVPSFLDMISSSVSFLGAIIDGAKPAIGWIWEEIIVPMGEFVGDLFISFLNFLTDAFTRLTDWARNNQTTVENISLVVLGFLAGIWIYNTTKNLIEFCKKLGDAFVTLGTKMATGGLQGAFFAAAVGILAAGIITLANQWDKMSPAERVITILTSLAAAATAAAIAIGVFHTAWSVGLAAAAIAGGLSLLGLSFAFGDTGSTGDAAKSAADNFYSSYDWNKTFTLPALATGAVLPPNKPFAAIVGDQKHGTNVEAPLDTIKQALFEVMASQGYGNGAENIELTVNLDGAVIYKNVVNRNKQNTIRTGKNALAY